MCWMHCFRQNKKKQIGVTLNFFNYRPFDQFSAFALRECVFCRSTVGRTPDFFRDSECCRSARVRCERVDQPSPIARAVRVRCEQAILIWWKRINRTSKCSVEGPQTSRLHAVHQSSSKVGLSLGKIVSIHHLACTAPSISGSLPPLGYCCENRQHTH